MTEVCIFDNPQHQNGGCIFDNNLLDTGKTRPYRKGWTWEELHKDDEDILTVLICATEVIH